jgi:hypothetical protein
MTRDPYVKDWWRSGGKDGVFASWDKDTGKLYLSAGSSSPHWINSIVMKVTSGNQAGDYAYEVGKSSECIVKLPLTNINARLSNYEMEMLYVYY